MARALVCSGFESPPLSPQADQDPFHDRGSCPDGKRHQRAAKIVAGHSVNLSMTMRARTTAAPVATDVVITDASHRGVYNYLPTVSCVVGANDNR